MCDLLCYLLQVLTWLLDAGCPVHNTHPERIPDQALHMACYQGYGPEAVKLLLAAGADPLYPNLQKLTPLQMTANQVRYGVSVTLHCLV